MPTAVATVPIKDSERRAMDSWSVDQVSAAATTAVSIACDPAEERHRKLRQTVRMKVKN